MNKFIGIVLIVASVSYGLKVKRDFCEEQNRWTAFGVFASVVGFFCGVCLLFEVFDLTLLFSK